MFFGAIFEDHLDGPAFQAEKKHPYSRSYLSKVNGFMALRYYLIKPPNRCSTI